MLIENNKDLVHYSDDHSTLVLLVEADNFSKDIYLDSMFVYLYCLEFAFLLLVKPLKKIIEWNEKNKYAKTNVLFYLANTIRRKTLVLAEKKKYYNL